MSSPTADNGMEIVANETFGPYAPIIRAANERYASRTVNVTIWDLPPVCSRTASRAGQVAKRIEASIAQVNDQFLNDLPNPPIGGVEKLRHRRICAMTRGVIAAARDLRSRSHRSRIGAAVQRLRIQAAVNGASP
ncbi:aldehyde dehydrogenase family protein [Bradyrhizobium sp. STM 3809]|uniref:aldehyde dehydrogenase family protein n=1 Tax=Bradyrhizobium sp. STM 3809 TaxID=551936 RepID=UPI00024097EB|nr:aldehyde dehydrogenase family protein [Bradyrhizobium sp. STM 3809]CCE01356.1 hypothetical protein BRAS3809_480002 [Bradyrhizobium sp. STM 3809]